MRWAKVLAIVAALAVVAAAVVVVAVRASIGSAPEAPPAGSAVAGLERPFGASAPWNVPVAQVPLDSRSDEWRDRLWRFAIGNETPDHPDSDPNRGRFGVEFGFVGRRHVGLGIRSARADSAGIIPRRIHPPPRREPAIIVAP